jgi:hypothetical protein
VRVLIVEDEPYLAEAICELDRRRVHKRPPAREIAGLRLDPFHREVYRDGRYFARTRKQPAMLAAEGGVVSAEELLECRGRGPWIGTLV